VLLCMDPSGLIQNKWNGMEYSYEKNWQTAHEAMGLCVLTASLRKPNGRRHSRRTATGLAAGQIYCKN